MGPLWEAPPAGKKQSKGLDRFIIFHYFRFPIMIMPAITASWIVVRTKPRRELLAQRNVERQGLATYLPKIFERGRVQPLFSSYLFVVMQQQWWFLRSTFGVLYPLMHGGQPELIRASVIDALRSRENSDGVIVLPKVEVRQTPWHQPLTIQGGAMDGLVGLYEGMQARDRVRVLMTFLGQFRTVTVPLQQVAGL
jgi:transcriptional antiterminator RfaH